MRQNVRSTFCCLFKKMEKVFLCYLLLFLLACLPFSWEKLVLPVYNKMSMTLGVLNIATAYGGITPPTDLLPYNGIVVTNPVAFSWTPGYDNRAIYLNVATNPDFNPIDVINWQDDGSHYYVEENTGKFMKGRTYYWRLVADDGSGNRVATETFSFTVGDFSMDPYYLVVNIGWPGGANNLAWEPTNPQSILDNAHKLEILKSAVGTEGTTSKKLAFSFVIPYFHPAPQGIETYKQTLRNVLSVSVQYNLPVLITLDGFEWWAGRPDLWNWWDPSKGGYNPENRKNVEWTGWSEDYAVREGWRNWGSPLKLNFPHPNLTSPKVIQANKEAFQQLVPIIRDWYENLPEEKKYLFAGIKVGWEVSIGVNYFYPVDDTPCRNNDAQNCIPFKNVYQIGYAAVKTAGIKTAGELTTNDLDRAVKIYIDELAKTAYDLGIPRQKIFTHLGPDHEPSAHPEYKFMSSNVLSPYAHPGYSFYTFGNGPTGIPDIGSTLQQIANTFWGVSEWGGPGLGADYSRWREVLSSYYNFYNNKFIVSYVEIINDSNGSSAFRDELREVSRWLHPPVIHSQVDGSNAVLHWSVPSLAKEVYLNVTRNPTPEINGGFKEVNVLNERVTGRSSLELRSLPPGVYYWKVFADNFGRRVISELGEFKIGDIKTLLVNYATNNLDYDFNSDGKVNVMDFGIMVK